MGRVCTGWHFRVQFIKANWVLYVMAGLLCILDCIVSVSSEEWPLMHFAYTAFATLVVVAALEFIKPLIQLQFNFWSSFNHFP